MKPVDQTHFGCDGNCFSACLASLFEIPIEDVPNFYHEAGPEPEAWWTAVREWLAARGWGILNFEVNDYVLTMPGYLIMAGNSPRNLHHATIWRDGKMIHDPHPSRGGIEAPLEVDMIYPLDPANIGRPFV